MESNLSLVKGNMANYISFSRIVFSIALLFSMPLSPGFFTIFVICGITDILDGYVARNYGSISDFGAKLDSFADIVFFISFLIVLLPAICYSSLMSLWILAIFLMKIFSIVVGFVKYGQFALPHTYLNKITGGLLVLLPFLLYFTSSKIVVPIVCFTATLAAVEELAIIITSQKLILDCKGIFTLH